MFFFSFFLPNTNLRPIQRSWMEIIHSFILISRRGRGIYTMSPRCDKLCMQMTHAGAPECIWLFFFSLLFRFFFVFSIHRSRIWWFPLLWRRDESDDEGSKEGSFSSSGKNIYIYKDKEMMMEKKEEKEGDGFWSSLAFGWESTQCDWYSNQLRQFHRHDSKWRGPGRGWCGNVIPIRLLYMYMWRREEKKKKKEKKESEKRMKKKIEEGEKETHRERERKYWLVV